MYGDPLILLLIVVLGVASLMLGAVYFLFRVAASVGRALFGALVSGRSTNPRRVGPAPGRRVCPREECRRVEHRAARYCSQCGAPLESVTRP